jgi:hypothetical protein
MRMVRKDVRLPGRQVYRLVQLGIKVVCSGSIKRGRAPLAVALVVQFGDRFPLAGSWACI